MSLRGPVLTLTARPEGPSLMGRVGRSRKVPLNFFELCGHLELVYIYLYTKQKLSPTFLWVSKFDVKLGVGEYNFRNYPTYVSFQIFRSKS